MQLERKGAAATPRLGRQRGKTEMRGTAEGRREEEEEEGKEEEEEEEEDGSWKVTFSFLSIFIFPFLSFIHPFHYYFLSSSKINK